MRVKDYIQAAHATIQSTGDAESLLKNLRHTLETRGLVSLYPAVLRGLIEKIRRSQQRGIPTVYIAREADAEVLKTEIHTALTRLGATEHRVVVDSTIIGGFVVKGKSERVDASYKNTLLRTYQKLTH